MPDFYLSTNLTNDTILCISPLTDECAAAAGNEIESDPLGYFLYERSASGSPNEISVLARLISEEAAWALSRLLNLE